MLSDKDKAWLLSLKPEDITKELIDTNFSYRYDVESKKQIPPRISLQEEFTLKPGEHPMVKSDTRTNVGQFIVNKALFERIPNVQKVVGYVAKPFDKKTIWANEAKMAKAMLMDKVTPEDWAKYIDAIQFFGFAFNTNVSVSFTPNTCKVLPSVKKKRAELQKKYKKELDEGNATVAVEIENELMDLAKEELKNDPGMTIYDSGCKPKFGVAYKNCFISRGPVYMPHKEKFEIGRQGFLDGLDKEDVPQYATSVINGSFAKAIDTGVAGYVTKKLFATYQSVVLGAHGSDCHTKGYREFVLNADDADKFKNRFVIDNGKLVELTEENMAKYVGKKVKMRSPMYCLYPEGKLCNKCAGEMFYRQGITNVGLTTSSLGNHYLNLLMKSFHESVVRLTSIDPEKILID
jgi:hypothetical protein